MFSTFETYDANNQFHINNTGPSSVNETCDALMMRKILCWTEMICF